MSETGKPGKGGLEDYLKSRQGAEAEREKAAQELLEKAAVERKEYHSKFLDTYLQVIKPVFEKITPVLKEYGHDLQIKHENIVDSAEVPEIRYDLLIGGARPKSIKLFIIGRGPGGNVVFYFEHFRQRVENNFHFTDLNSEKVESTILNAISTFDKS